MKPVIFLSLMAVMATQACTGNLSRNAQAPEPTDPDPVEIQEPEPVDLTRGDIKIRKELLYDQYTMEDTYPYKDTVRYFQWDKIKDHVAVIENAQRDPAVWVYAANKSNINGQAPVAKDPTQSPYGNISDSYGVERRQAAPLYNPSDMESPERYAKDGCLMKFIDKQEIVGETEDTTTFLRVKTTYFDGEWLVPEKFTRRTESPVTFHKLIFVDRTNQNICTLERSGEEWLVRSMNPSTTGRFAPPYAYETPLGIYMVQEKKEKMIYNKDGSPEYGGFAPYATRFCAGAYVHGVPTEEPGTHVREYSNSLGTTPRSHMCVRTPTSHAKFVFDWAPVEESLVVVIE